MRQFYRSKPIAMTVLVMTSSCTGNVDTSGSRPSSPWENALTSLETTSSGVYSFRFDAPQPAEPYFRLGVHGTSATAACGRYDGSIVGSADFWFLDVAIFDLRIGPHGIVLASPRGAASPTANVTLLHRSNNAYADSYDALGGTVTVDSAPSPQEFKSGSRLTGSIDADFPMHAFEEVVCHGGISATPDATMQEECTCRDDHDQRTTCVPAPGMTRCCYDYASARIRIHVRFSALTCSAMCKYAIGLPDYCADL